jgi:hypothetical protein
MRGEKKGEIAFIQTFFFGLFGQAIRVWLHVQSLRQIFYNFVQDCTLLPIEVCNLKMKLLKCLPFDSTIEAIESSIVTKGYGMKLVILGMTWEIYREHGGMH